MRKRSHKLVRLAFLLTLIYSLLPVTEALAQSNSNWQRLGSAAPQSLLQRVQEDYATDSNSERPVDISQMRFLQVRQSGAKPLFLIDTRLPGRDANTNPTCGQSGCLFYGYTSSADKGYMQVLNGYINDFRIQNAPPVIQPIKKVVNKLPCLQLTLYQSQSNQLLSSVLCFDGKEYQPIAPPRALKQLER